MALELYERVFDLNVRLRAWLENVSMEQAEELVPRGDLFVDLIRDELSGEWFTAGSGADWYIHEMAPNFGWDTFPLKAIGYRTRLTYQVGVDVTVEPDTQVEDLHNEGEKLRRLLVDSVIEGARDLDLNPRRVEVERTW